MWWGGYASPKTPILIVIAWVISFAHEQPREMHQAPTYAWKEFDPVQASSQDSDSISEVEQYTEIDHAYPSGLLENYHNSLEHRFSVIRVLDWPPGTAHPAGMEPSVQISTPYDSLMLHVIRLLAVQSVAHAPLSIPNMHDSSDVYPCCGAPGDNHHA